MTSEKTPRRGHWKRNLAIALGVVIVLAVGGPFFYIHVIQSDPPKKLQLTSEPAASAAAGSTVSADGSWKVASGSTAGYRVHEVLIGQKTTAVGRTADVSGSMSISGTTVSTADFTVQMATVTSDRDERDQQFRGRIMDVSSYPTATFRLTKPIDLGTVPAAGVAKTVNGTGTLTLHGTTRTVTVPLTARRSGATIAVSGSIPVTFADYNIANPSFGPVTTDDHGSVEFLLNFSKS